MATLTTQNFTTTVQNFAATAQGACATLLDFSIGSILRAAAEAASGIVLWLQGLIITLLATTRLNTSFGSDVDTYVSDFGMTRLAATASTGPVTFARFTPTNTATIPNGTLLQTFDGSLQFQVVADLTQAAYSSTANGYIVPANTPSITATVQCLTPGSIGNISANTLTIVQATVNGVDTVTNIGALTNGLDAETDAALKLRFVAFINALARATPAAIGYAVISSYQGLQYTIIENQDYTGAADNGMVTLIIDDGSGSIPSPLLTLVANSVNLYRGAGVRVGIFPAVAITATVIMSLTYQQGFTPQIVAGAVTTAVTNYINGAGLGNPVFYNQLFQIAFNTPGVLNVASLLVNGTTADIMPTLKQTVKAGQITVT